MVSAEDLDDRVRRLKDREAEAQRRRAQLESQLAIRQDRLAQLESQLLELFGVGSPDEARARLAELQGELEDELRLAERSLEEVSSSG